MHVVTLAQWRNESVRIQRGGFGPPSGYSRRHWKDSHAIKLYRELNPGAASLWSR